MGGETPSWSEDASLRWAPDPAPAFVPDAPDAPQPVHVGPWSPRDDIASDNMVHTQAATPEAATIQL
jgi:hypothetical protein